DTLYGGDHNDFLEGGADNDVLDGGDGEDTTTYASATSGVSVDLYYGTATGGAGDDTLSDIENVIGSSYADVITGGGGINVLWGGDGNDTIDGGGDSDTIFGGAGDDFLTVPFGKGAAGDVT